MHTVYGRDAGKSGIKQQYHIECCCRHGLVCLLCDVYVHVYMFPTSSPVSASASDMHHMKPAARACYTAHALCLGPPGVASVPVEAAYE